MVDSKSREECDELDVDLTMDIVKDFSNEIFNNIEQLNKRRSLVEKQTDGSAEKGSDVSLTIEDETADNSHDISARKPKHVTKHLMETRPVKDVKSSKKDGRHIDVDGAEKSLLERRRVSLPEITTIPNVRAIRIRWAISIIRS